MTKRILTLFFSLIVILNIVGCGGSNEKTPSEETPEVPPEVQEAVDQVIQESEAAAQNQQ